MYGKIQARTRFCVHNQKYYTFEIRARYSCYARASMLVLESHTVKILKNTRVPACRLPGTGVLVPNSIAEIIQNVLIYRFTVQQVSFISSSRSGYFSKYTQTLPKNIPKMGYFVRIFNRFHRQMQLRSSEPAVQNINAELALRAAQLHLPVCA